VQNGRRSEVNPPFFNTLLRFAQYLCNERVEREFFVTSKHRAAAKRLVWHEVEAKENILRKYFRYS
jgi:hypothetical protein